MGSSSGADGPQPANPSRRLATVVALVVGLSGAAACGTPGENLSAGPGSDGQFETIAGDPASTPAPPDGKASPPTTVLTHSASINSLGEWNVVLELQRPFSVNNQFSSTDHVILDPAVQLEITDQVVRNRTALTQETPTSLADGTRRFKELMDSAPKVEVATAGARLDIADQPGAVHVLLSRAPLYSADLLDAQLAIDESSRIEDVTGHPAMVIGTGDRIRIFFQVGDVAVAVAADDINTDRPLDSEAAASLEQWARTVAANLRLERSAQ